MDKKLILGSLALDLKRVAIGLHRNSLVTASQFKNEALNRGQELEKIGMDGYTSNLLISTKKALRVMNPRVAEDLLMYSTLFQNLSQKKF